ncbi:MAG: RNHCP domain-containing protein [Candidatus Gracilibacteria bacterium]|nr:RNHCP domain-containing protein [Candidatus Gracilibacteria bacterium]
MEEKKNFIHRNEGFDCGHCGLTVPSQSGSCRNHCTKCLYSLHVDKEVPGDRESRCKALMKPVSLDMHSKKGQMIVHECMRCRKMMKNRVAEDDDSESVIALGLEVLKG